MKMKKEVGGKWEFVKIPEVLFFQEGPGVRNTQFTTSGVKLLNVGNINFGNLNLDATKIYISEEEAYGKYNHFLVEEGDLLIASSGIVVDNFHNKITWAKKEHLPLCLNTSTIRFRSLDNQVLDLRFFSYFLKTRIFADQLSRLITGSAQLNFGPSHIKQISLPLPPLATQQRIAAILDAADALRRKDQELLSKYDELAQAIFIDMFGDPVKNEKGWGVRKLGEVVHPNRIITYGIVQAGPNIPDGIPYIKTGDIKNCEILTNGLQRTSIEIAKAYSRSQLYKDDIVMSIRATVGTVALLPDELVGANLTQGTARISPSDCVRRIFLFFYLKSEFVQNWISINSKGATFREITLAKLRELPVQLPNISIQIKFEKAIAKLVEAKDAATFSSLESSSLFHSLLQQAFNGKLVA